MLRVTCNPQEAGTYQVHIVLSSSSDVRVLVVEMVARRALQPLSLVLESPTRHRLTQEVSSAPCHIPQACMRLSCNDRWAGTSQTAHQLAHTPIA